MSEDRQERFAAYVEAMTKVIGHADREEPLRDYCLGFVDARRAQERRADRGNYGTGAGVGQSTSHCCISSPTRHGRMSAFLTGYRN